MLFLQCLHSSDSGLSSSGRPVANVSLALSSNGFTTGPGEAGTEFVDGVSVPRFLSSDHVSATFFHDEHAQVTYHL
jgi:hypothetical protein